MSYTVTDRLFYNLIQYTLIEAPNNGASFGSGLYTSAEVVARTNYRLDLFNKLTAMYVKNNVTDAVIANVKGQKATNLTDVIDMLEVSYKPSSTWKTIPKGSSTEADAFLADQVGAGGTTSVPKIYTFDTAGLLAINLYPPPDTTGTLRMCYAPKIGTLPTTPDGTTINLPDDFTPYVKFGVLADLFNKQGEASDPVRGQLCEQIFQLGVSVAKSWVSGFNN